MTTAELERLLKSNGCEIRGHNKKHDRWWSPITGETFDVGRHAKEQVRTGTLHKILKAAGIKLK